MAANEKAVSTRIEPSRSGQTAHDLRVGPQPEYVDKNRSHLNRILIEPLTNDALRGEWHEVKTQIGKKGKIRSNQNLSYAGIITFGHEAQGMFEGLTSEQQDAAFLEVGKKIAERFNTRLTGMVFHGDETAPHAHFQLRGMADDGTMLSQVVKRGALREVQDITAEVMARYAPGIERGKDKWVRIEEGEDFAATVNRSVKKLRDEAIPELRAKIATKEAELAEAQAKLQTNLERLAKAKKQTTEEGAKAEKARKRVETYERRADTAREDVANLESILEDLRKRRSDLEADNRALDETLAQKKTNVTSLRARKAALLARLKALSAA
jgi:hypothetical protein